MQSYTRLLWHRQMLYQAISPVRLRCPLQVRWPIPLSIALNKNTILSRYKTPVAQRWCSEPDCFPTSLGLNTDNSEKSQMDKGTGVANKLQEPAIKIYHWPCAVFIYPPSRPSLLPSVPLCDLNLLGEADICCPFYTDYPCYSPYGPNSNKIAQETNS